MFQSLEPLKNIALAKYMYYEQWINSKDITLTCFEWDQTLLYTCIENYAPFFKAPNEIKSRKGT